jgi:glycosyltransferase involved in cell wall biosynthesis
MAISTSIRPRASSERARVIHLLTEAPRVVGIAFPDDGWLCAALWSSGRMPVWCNDGDPSHANSVLKRLGLPPLGSETPDALVGADLQLDRTVSPAFSALPAPEEEQPLVTILICTYNRADMIMEALHSAHIQTWPREIVVVNDGSDDGTRELLDELDGKDGLRIIHQENSGKPTALNVGLAAAKGKAVLVLDDDDRLTPGALHILATALFSNPLLGCVIGDTMIFKGETGEPIKYRPATRVPPGIAEHALLQQVPGMPGASLIRMSTQRAAGPYDPDLIRGQDMDMYLRLSRAGDIQGVPIPTFWYRSHDGLRGSAAGQWKKSDRGLHDDRFMACVAPVFARRFTEMGEITDRPLSHSWALGLHLRRLPDLAVSELDRWPGPHSQREAWIRTQVGLPSQVRTDTESVLIIDDGDPGALQTTLERHTGNKNVWVNLEVPRDPLGSVRLFWPGNYGAQERLHQWFRGPAPIHVRLSSDPIWAPPSIDSTRWFPDVDSVNAVLALTAALGWPEPNRFRLGFNTAEHELVIHSREARALLQEGHSDAALKAILTIVRNYPTWPGGWYMAGEGFQLRGETDRAQTWFARVESIRSVS